VPQDLVHYPATWQPLRSVRVYTVVEHLPLSNVRDVLYESGGELQRSICGWRKGRKDRERTRNSWPGPGVSG